MSRLPQSPFNRTHFLILPSLGHQEGQKPDPATNTMPAPFGFSVGDFLAVIQLAVKICQALDESSDDLKEYNDVKFELLTLTQVIEDIKTRVFGGSLVSERSAERLHDVLQNCFRILGNFGSFLSSYNDLSSALRKISWVLCGKAKIQGFRSRIQVGLAALSLIQLDMQRDSLDVIRKEMREASDTLSLEVRQQVDSIRCNVVATLQWPGDQQTIRFQDAIGRRYPVSLEICQTFKDFMSFLQFMFRNSPLLPAINSSAIWLFTPSGLQPKLWYLLQKDDWELMARPGMILGMSLNMSCIESNPCSEHSKNSTSGALDHATGSNVHLKIPLPEWATYEPDTEFAFIQRSHQKIAASSSHPTADGVISERRDDHQCGKVRNEDFALASDGWDTCLACMGGQQDSRNGAVCLLCDGSGTVQSR
ncbi:hypothetical protein F5Y16DRAFT_79227 [Xylariaceae sp. FL0255]|nr:hypothetical protein F5Y16DRAFT_79227 [Xylariaceae sp. FL0255]